MELDLRSRVFDEENPHYEDDDDEELEADDDTDDDDDDDDVSDADLDEDDLDEDDDDDLEEDEADLEEEDDDAHLGEEMQDVVVTVDQPERGLPEEDAGDQLAEDRRLADARHQPAGEFSPGKNDDDKAEQRGHAVRHGRTSKKASRAA